MSFIVTLLAERSSAERACDTEETYDEEPPMRRLSMAASAMVMREGGS